MNFILQPIRNKDKVCVVIGGRMYSGKTYFAKQLEEVLWSKSGYQLHRASSAGTLKDLVNRYYGINNDEAEDVYKERIRPQYQQFATEVVRKHYADDFWITLALRTTERFLVFDDIRFPVEIETIKKHSLDTVFIWIGADEETRQKRCEEKFGAGSYVNTNHVSEQALTGKEPYWDYRFNNSASSDELETAKYFIAGLAFGKALQSFDKQKR